MRCELGKPSASLLTPLRMASAESGFALITCCACAMASAPRGLSEHDAARRMGSVRRRQRRAADSLSVRDENNAE